MQRCARHVWGGGAWKILSSQSYNLFKRWVNQADPEMGNGRLGVAGVEAAET
jgi:hypothetical protein